MTKDGGNSAYADVAPQHSGNWICLKTTDEDDNTVYAFAELIEHTNNSQNQGNGQGNTAPTSRQSIDGNGDAAAVAAEGGSSQLASKVVVVEEDKEIIARTGVFENADDNYRLIGYILMAAAILGAARILIIKKYKSSNY